MESIVTAMNPAAILDKGVRYKPFRATLQAYREWVFDTITGRLFEYSFNITTWGNNHLHIPFSLVAYIPFLSTCLVSQNAFWQAP